MKFLAVGLALAAGFTPIPSTTIERWFSTGLYPALQRQVTPLSNLLSFAVLDVLAVAGCAAVVAAVIRAAYAARRTRRLLPLVRVLGQPDQTRPQPRRSSNLHDAGALCGLLARP